MAKGIPVVIAANGRGIPVKVVQKNAPLLEVAQNGRGIPIVLSDRGAPFMLIGGYDPDAQAYFAAMTVQPSAARKDLINALIVGLKADGIWPRIQWLSLLASHSEQAGRLNIKTPAQIASAVNSPVFTVDRGFAGDGATTYLDTNVSNTTVVDTDNSLFVFIETKATSRVNVIGTQSARYIITHGGALNPLYYGFTSTLSTVGGGANNKDFVIGSRSGADQICENNGVAGTPVSVTTTAPTTLTTRLFGTAFDGRLAMGGFGLSLNQTQRDALRMRVLTYLAAIGAN